jgi:hypothetical protein
MVGSPNIRTLKENDITARSDGNFGSDRFRIVPDAIPAVSPNSVVSVSSSS